MTQKTVKVICDVCGREVKEDEAYTYLYCVAANIKIRDAAYAHYRRESDRWDMCCDCWREAKKYYAPGKWDEAVTTSDKEANDG